MKDKLSFPSFTHDSIAGYCNDKPLWAQYRDDKKSKYIFKKDKRRIAPFAYVNYFIHIICPLHSRKSVSAMYFRFVLLIVYSFAA